MTPLAKGRLQFGLSLAIMMFAIAFPRAFLFYEPIHLAGTTWAITLLASGFLIFRSLWIFFPKES